MKNILFVAALLWVGTTFAQAPQGFHYQAVPRKADGATFPAGSTLKVLFQIRENTADGPVRRAEVQTLTIKQQRLIEKQAQQIETLEARLRALEAASSQGK